MTCPRPSHLGLLLAATLAGCWSPIDLAADDDSGVGSPSSPWDEDGDGVAPPEDCDDANAAVHPGRIEFCNGLDDDCDGLVDADDPGLGNLGSLTCYVDADGDGSGAGELVLACGKCPDGRITDGADCDDGDPAVHVEAPEVCDGRDDDCDGAVDEGLPLYLLPWYGDDDEDGFGSPGSGQFESCDPEATPEAGYVQDDTDCDDGDAAVHPGAPESCDAIDSDCDGESWDSDSVDAGTWYRDADQDGYGDAAWTVSGCARPLGYAGVAGDCDDGAAGVNPAAAELCGDGLDDDCDGVADDGC